jgi:inosose dehydratase
MPVTVATAPINWHNEANPPAVMPLPYPALLEDMVDAGYGATEWSPSLPGFVPLLRKDLEHHALQVTGAYFAASLLKAAWHELEVNRALEQALFLQRLGAKYLVVGERGNDVRHAISGRVTPKDALDEATFAVLLQGLNKLGEALKPTGIRPVFHNHVATYIETPGEIERLAKGLDPDLVGFCLDTGHCVYGGGDARQMLEQLGERVEYIHLKDVNTDVLVTVRSEGLTFTQALEQVVFCPLGEGCAQTERFLHDLDARGYDGVLVLEQDTSWDPSVSVRHNRAFVRRVMGW